MNEGDSMKQRSKIQHYILKVFDEERNEWTTYEGNNDLKPRTATVLLINFRLFKLTLQLLAILLGFIIGKFISSLL